MASCPKSESVQFSDVYCIYLLILILLFIYLQTPNQSEALPPIRPELMKPLFSMPKPVLAPKSKPVSTPKPRAPPKPKAAKDGAKRKFEENVQIATSGPATSSSTPTSSQGESAVVARNSV